MATPRSPFSTVVDTELEGMPRGPELSAAAAQRMIQRSPMAMPPSRIPEPDPSGLVMTWGDFQVRHPEWRGDYWAECRGLYAGGQRLLGDPAVLKRLFPAHMYEAPDVYAARQARAHYFPYPGTIIDHLLAGLGTDPFEITFSQIDDKGVASMPDNAEWWEDWVSDVTDEAERPEDYGLEIGTDDDDDEGGRPMHEFLVDCLREACQTQTAWVLGDIPSSDSDQVIDSKLAAERSGMLDPYLCLVPAEQVIDWHCDDRGRLEWALILTVSQPRATPRARRKNLLHTYVLWTAEQWIRYEVSFDPQLRPNENTPYAPVAMGDHGFGRVPLERLQLPEGLYPMGKLHSLAREHFNKRASMSWAEYKSLFAILYEFLGPEQSTGLPVAEAQMDAGRATNQIRGQGYTQTRGKDDDAKYVGPDPTVFTAARESCNDTMREMHRVMFSMAMSANMDAAALSRSAESKDKDMATTEVLLAAFGGLLLRFARRLLVLAALGRQEAPPKCTITGYRKFDVAGIDVKIAEAGQLFGNQIPMISPTVKELYLARFYGDLIGDMSQEQLERVREEIREGITQEELAAQIASGMGPDGQPLAAPGDGSGDGADPGDDEAPEPEAKPAPVPKPAGARSMIRKSAKK